MSVMWQRVKAWILIVFPYIWSTLLLHDIWFAAFSPPGRTVDAQAGIGTAITTGWGTLMGVLVAALLAFREASKPGISLAVGKAFLVLFVVLLGITAFIDPSSIAGLVVFGLIFWVFTPFTVPLGIQGILQKSSGIGLAGLMRAFAPDVVLFVTALLLAVALPTSREQAQSSQ